MISILIADDHTLLRQGLVALFAAQEDIAVVGEASNGRQVIELSRETSPDVALVDVSMPDLNGVGATRLLSRESPRTRVLALSMYKDHDHVERMLSAGASGYVLKTDSMQDIVAAVRHVAKGHCYLSPEVAGPVVERYLSSPGMKEVPDGPILTAREREVLQLIAEGLTSKEIAQRLHISARTVDNHRQNIMARLKIDSVAGLTKYALQAGLTSLDF